jgi:hypothetical protein
MTTPEPLSPSPEIPDDDELANRFAGLDKIELRRRLWHIERQLADNVYRRVDAEEALRAARSDTQACYCDECLGIYRSTQMQGPEIRYQLRNWHHVTCAGLGGQACNCWRQREELIAELAKREVS